VRKFGAPARPWRRANQSSCVVVGDPGVLVSPGFAEEFAKRLRNCSVVHLGPGAHYLQEDHPQAIGANIKQWLTDLALAEIATGSPVGARRNGTVVRGIVSGCELPLPRLCQRYTARNPGILLTDRSAIDINSNDCYEL
jgi:hypothetical protein